MDAMATKAGVMLLSVRRCLVSFLSSSNKSIPRVFNTAADFFMESAKGLICIISKPMPGHWQPMPVIMNQTSRSVFCWAF